MPDFVDSNVIIGYHFPMTDGWADAAQIIFDKPNCRYTGSYVWEECFGTAPDSGRCATKRHKIEKEFRRTLAALKRGIEVRPLLTLILKRRKEEDVVCWIFHILILVAEQSKYDRKAMITNLENAKTDYENILFTRCQELKDNTRLLIHRRRVGHNDVYRELEKYVPDKADIEVLLDAHDLGLTVTDLFFYTGDGVDINNNKRVILDHTEISDIYYLGDIATYINF